jgi:hypothetical protein
VKRGVQLVDMFTKVLDHGLFNGNSHKLGIIDIYAPNLRGECYE